MHILFVDESGTPPKPGKQYPRYFVVGGIYLAMSLGFQAIFAGIQRVAFPSAPAPEDTPI